MNYYIYHIPQRRKIGCTINLIRRMKQHKWNGSYEILESYTDKLTASKREGELQVEYGYPLDHKSYDYITILGTANAVKGGDACTRVVDVKHRARLGGIASRKLTMEDADIIRDRYSNEKISQRKLAKEYGVSQCVIQGILLYGRYR